MYQRISGNKHMMFADFKFPLFKKVNEINNGCCLKLHGPVYAHCEDNKICYMLKRIFQRTEEFLMVVISFTHAGIRIYKNESFYNYNTI